jgi:hypothetical protein
VDIGKYELADVESESFRDLLVVRYVGVLVGKFGGDESRALEVCSVALGMGKTECRGIWDRRDVILGCNDAQFELSGDVLKQKIRRTYHKLVDELFLRDFSKETVKVILESLKTVAQLEMGLKASDGVLGDSVAGLGNSVKVVGSNVIIVPMPDSARGSTYETGGRVVSREGMESPRKENIDWLNSKSKSEREAEKEMFTPVELDALEEVKEMADKMREKTGK